MTNGKVQIENVTDYSYLDSEERRLMVMLLKEKDLRRSRRLLYTYFPDTGPLRRELYTKHVEFFNAGKTFTERCFMAANRVGKTIATGYELVLHLTGQYPDWWDGRRFDRPVKAWAAGTTAETTRDILQNKLLGPLDALGTGLIPYDCIIGEPRKDSGIPDAIETVLIKHITGGTSRLQFKAYKQGRKSFEGVEQDVILLDEEPPMDIYVECLTRLMTTKGIILLGFTPLEGLSETVLTFMPGGQVPKEGVGTKYVVGATWEDAPHLEKKEKDQLYNSYPIHLRDARSKGIPAIGSGAIYPIAEEDITVSDFPIPEYWPQVYRLDVGWKWNGVVWVAWDRDRDIVFVTGVYKRGQAEPEVHASAIKKRGEWIPGVIDPAAEGSNQKDGTKLLEEYEDLGLDLTPADNSVEAGLFEVYKRMTTGRFKVFRSCVEWFEEYRIYRRDKRGKVVKENDHLMDPTRYIVLSGLDIAKTKPIKHWARTASVTEIMDHMPLGRIQ
jgi:phage terminase large subunit-like protein